jgi:hypothetical protein
MMQYDKQAPDCKRSARPQPINPILKVFAVCIKLEKRAFVPLGLLFQAEKVLLLSFFKQFLLQYLLFFGCLCNFNDNDLPLFAP